MLKSNDLHFFLRISVFTWISACASDSTIAPPAVLGDAATTLDAAADVASDGSLIPSDTATDTSSERPDAVASLVPTRLVLPGATPGISFDDMKYVPSAGFVVVPAGRSGNIDLVDPATQAVTPIAGFTVKGTYAAGHSDGVTSADVANGYLFTIDHSRNRLEIVDLAQKKLVGGLDKPGLGDYLRYVDSTHELWMSEPGSAQLQILTVSSAAPPVVARGAAIDAGGEGLAIDLTRGIAYTSDFANDTYAVSLSTHAVLHTWTNACSGSRGLALDEAHGFLIIGCAEGGATVLDVNTGATLSTATAASGIDIIDYNPQLRHVYLPGGTAKMMTILALSSEGKLSPLAEVPTANDASCVVSDRSGNVYVCDPEAGALLVFHDTLPAAP